MSGTSMAAPNAAAVAGYIWSTFPEYTREQVVQKLLTSTDNIDSINNSRYTNKLGAGRINASLAVDEEANFTTVRQVWFEDGKLNIHFRGLVSAVTGRSRGAEIIETEEQSALEIGQSVMRIRLTDSQAGTYRIHVSADQMQDPFGRAIDGDNDGLEGGNFVQTIEL